MITQPNATMIDSCEYQTVHSHPASPAKKKMTKVFKIKDVFVNAPNSKKEKVISKKII